MKENENIQKLTLNIIVTLIKLRSSLLYRREKLTLLNNIDCLVGIQKHPPTYSPQNLANL